MYLTALQGLLTYPQKVAYKKQGDVDIGVSRFLEGPGGCLECFRIKERISNRCTK